MGNNPAVLHAFGSPQNRGHAEAIFREFDKDKNGRLDKREYAAFLEAYWTHLVKTQPEIKGVEKSVVLSGLMPYDDVSVDFFEFWGRLKAHAEGASIGNNEPTMRCHACTGVSAIPASVPNGAFLKCPFCDSLNTISKPGSSVSSPPAAAAVSSPHAQSPSVGRPSNQSVPVARPVSGAMSPSHGQVAGGGGLGFQPLYPQSAGASPHHSPMHQQQPLYAHQASSPVHHSPNHLLHQQHSQPSPHYHVPPPLHVSSPMGGQPHALSPPNNYQPVLQPSPQSPLQVASPVGSGSVSPGRCLSPGCESFGNAANQGHCNKCGSSKKLASHPSQPGSQQSPIAYVPSPSPSHLQQPVYAALPQHQQQQPPAQMYAQGQGNPQAYVAPQQFNNQGPQVYSPPQQPAQNPQYASHVSNGLSREQVAEEIFRLLDANGDDSIHPREAGFLAELFEHINLRAADGLLKELRTAEKFGNEEHKSLSRLEMLTKINSLSEAAMREIHQKLFSLDAKFRTELLTALFNEWDSNHNQRMDEDEAQLFGVIAQTKITELFKGRDPELAKRLEARVGMFQREVAKCRNMGGITVDRFIQFWMAWSLVHLYAVFHEVCPPQVFARIDGNPFGSFAKHQVEFALEHSKKLAFQTTGLYLLYEKGDGNCLFRSVARLVKGDPEAHFVSVRLESARLMQSEKQLHPGDGYFEEIWGFPTYQQFLEARLDRKRWERGCVGNKKDWGFDPDLQALSAVYQRPIHIYRHNHTAAKREPDMMVFPVGSPRSLFESTRPITLYYTGAHYQSLVKDPDFTHPMGPGPDPLSASQAAAFESSMQQLQVQANRPDWVCDFCANNNLGAEDTCGRCKIKPRR